MYANLLGQKAYHRLNDNEMGAVIGVSRNTFRQKLRSGRFSPDECKKYCEFFGKSFEYLFATEDDSQPPITEVARKAGMP